MYRNGRVLSSEGTFFLKICFYLVNIFNKNNACICFLVSARRKLPGTLGGNDAQGTETLHAPGNSVAIMLLYLKTTFLFYYEAHPVVTLDLDDHASRRMARLDFGRDKTNLNASRQAQKLHPETLAL